MATRRELEATRLRSRWSEDPLGPLRRPVIDRLTRGQDLSDLDLGEIDGRHDLRGIFSDEVQGPGLSNVGPGILTVGRPPAEPPAAGGSQRTRWRDLDLSFADLRELRWFNVDVERCRLDYANFEGLRCWGVTVTDSSLLGADLRNSSWGAHRPAEFPRSRWQRLDLRRADLRWSICEADLDTIDFSGAKFTRVNWGWTNLGNLTFRGVVHGLEIGGLPVRNRPSDWRLERVDFRNAKLRDVTFHGVDLGVVDILLPSNEEHWLVPDWSEYLGRVASAAGALPPGALRIAAETWVEYAARDRGPQQTVGFIATRDVTALGGNQLLRVLDAARRET